MKCEKCGAIYNITEPINTCKKCGGLLEVVYDYEQMINDDVPKKLKLPKESTDMWYYKDLLPHPETSEIITLGEGGSVLRYLQRTSERLGIKIFAKYYGTNPTGTHKDLGMSVAMSMAKWLGIKVALTFSTGNAATSLATYANIANIRPIIITRTTISFEKLYNILALGAEVIQIEDLINPWEVLDQISKKINIYMFTNFINPYRAEGHKTLAYEIYEKLKSDVDFVVVPLGTGGGLWGTWKGFKELKIFGLMNNLPRMVAVQPEAVMHTVKAYMEGKEVAKPYGNPANTIVQSLADSEPFYGAIRPLRVLKESNGIAVAVNDNEVVNSILELGKEGYFVEPAAATTLAGVEKALEQGLIDKGETVVLSLTGSGLKQPEAIKDAVKGKTIKLSKNNYDALLRIIGGVAL
ncbi:MAG: threonine synthase [Fervidicoccus sp.]